jgi:hypothetical protein
VIQRIRARGPGQLVGGGIPERPARRGEHDAFHVRAATGLHCLKDRRVLAVDRQDGRAVSPGQRHQHRPGHHQRLFVGDGHLAAQLHRSQRSRQTSCPHDGRHDAIGLHRRHQIRKRRISREDAATARQRVVRAHRLRIGQGDRLGLPLSRLFREHLRIGTRSQADHVKLVRQQRDHFQRVAPNRAGGTQDDDPLFHR